MAGTPSDKSIDLSESQMSNVASGAQLKSVDSIINHSYSRSTILNMERAERLLISYAREHKADDPKTVSPNSTMLVMNFLVEKCRYNSASALKIDTFGGYVQGLRLVYSKYGNRGTWICDAQNQKATGNPLIQNPDFENFWRAYRVMLARYGGVKLRARPLSAEIVCDHAEQFWFGSNVSDIMDVAFHTIAVLGLYLGLRYDEISKLLMKHVSIGRQSATITLTVAIKNSTVERTYELGDWDGKTPLSYSVYMDPFIALHTWVLTRGFEEGFLFPDITNTQAGRILIYSKSLSSNKFVSFMRRRLMDLGTGEADANAYTGHSLKRGCVQLHRSLGYMDEFIMRKLGMVGPNAYANYCAAYNNDAPKELPRFHSVERFIEHAEAISGEANWIHDRDCYEEFEKEVYGDCE